LKSYDSETLLTSSTEAVTTPLGYIPAAIGLYKHLRLPQPCNPTLEKTPIIIYGGSSPVGAFAIKLAQSSNIYPIIAIAGRGKAFVSSLVDPAKGDVVLDSRDGTKAVAASIRELGLDIEYGFDAISTHESLGLVGSLLNPKTGKLAEVIGQNKPIEGIPASVEQFHVVAPYMRKPNSPESKEGKARLKIGHREFEFMMFKWLGYALAEGLMEGHPSEIIPGGLKGVSTMMKNVKGGVNSGVKDMVRIADIKGI
jgi:NADPH2:quinone reductase